MSGVVTLRLRAPLDAALDLDGVTPDRFTSMRSTEIALLPASLGGRPVSLGDLFDISGDSSSHVRIEGDLSAATRVGAGMSAGRLDVIGSVGDDAGMAMSGGVLTISGDAGDRLCAGAPGSSKGMTGGEAIVAGSAGSDVAARCRRGLIVVGGSTGPGTGRDMIAGTVIVLGRTGPHPGTRSKRGSIVAIGGIDVPATYRYACTYEPPYVRLVLTYLRRQYGIPMTADAVSAAYRRYCGDAGEPGKGEILERVV